MLSQQEADQLNTALAECWLKGSKANGLEFSAEVRRDFPMTLLMSMESLRNKGADDETVFEFTVDLLHAIVMRASSDLEMESINEG